MTENERDGKLLCVVAVASVFVWVLISDGYDVRVSPLANLYYTMKVLEVELT